MARREKYEFWCACGARDELDKLLRDETIPINRVLMGPKIAYKVSPVFQKVEYVYFRNKLNDMRNKYKERRAWAEEDDFDLQGDLLLKPRPTYDVNGKPTWNGSEAQKLLRQDLPKYLKKKKKNPQYMPRDLQKTRPEYQKFTLKKFRKHIYQETRRWKFHNYLEAKADAKKKKMKKKCKKRKKGNNEEEEEEEEDEQPCRPYLDLISDDSDEEESDDSDESDDENDDWLKRLGGWGLMWLLAPCKEVKNSSD